MRLSRLDKLVLLRIFPLTLALFWLAPILIVGSALGFKLPLKLTWWDGGSMLAILVWLSVEFYLNVRKISESL